MNDERFLAKDVRDFAKRTIQLLSLHEEELQGILKKMRARATDFFEDSFSRKVAASDFFNFQSWYEYKHHLQATMPELCSKQCAFAPTSDKMAIVIEPRRSPLMEYVVRNAAFYLDNKWRLRVYHGTENADFVREKKIQPFSLQRKKNCFGARPHIRKTAKVHNGKKKKKKKGTGREAQHHRQAADRSEARSSGDCSVVDGEEGGARRRKRPKEQKWQEGTPRWARRRA